MDRVERGRTRVKTRLADTGSIAEAATILSTTVKAVESRLYRARGQLRQRLTCWLGTT